MSPSCHPMAGAGAPSLDVPLLFLAGLTVSLGHCLGMCGPLQAAFVLGAKGRGRLLPTLLRYHLARVAGYAILGAALGLLGSSLRLGPGTARLQGGLSIAAGAVMVPVALSLLAGAAVPRWIEFPGIADRIGKWIRTAAGRAGAGRDLLLGLANGFLPCGAVAAVALTAVASAHTGVGALLLLSYGAGTVPVLLAAGLASARLGPHLRARWYRLGAVLVLVLALQLVLRGLAVMGFMPHLTLGAVVFW